MKHWTELENLQPVAVKMLTNSLKKDRLAHAYLFQGPGGTGKKDASLLLAKSFFCPNRKGAEPCHECRECTRIDSGNHPDVHWIKPEGQSIKKDQILHLQKEFTYTGLESNQKVYIIDQADTMTVNASNRLLKFLEEPSRKTIAILLTENSQSILNTIRSRCQMIAFKSLPAEQLKKQLLEKGIPESTARLCSTLTNSIDEAASLSEDEWFAKARKIVIKLIETLHDEKSEAYLFIHKLWMEHFGNREQLALGLDLLLIWYNDFIQFQIGREQAIVYEHEKEKYKNYAYMLSVKKAREALENILEAKRKLMANVHSTLVMEQLVLQLQR
ncbi:MAG: DNA polymerase III subunit delta' [Bacillaceae bacterium]|nr:DNA polymerase III subunit delta' [Bacillaceae bacterium]